MFFFRAVAAVLVATQVIACSPDTISYHRQGIGTDLRWSGQENATQLLTAYIGAICEQAGIGRADRSDCDDRGFSPAAWGLFVQAGMNDIDLRCDSYLAWLDDRRRSSEPILKQIAAISETTVGVMGVRPVSREAISIVGQAFGLAADTFTNINSRLLLAVEQSTVQTIVLRRRHEFRLGIGDWRVDNRPAAVHALRSYLGLCLPFTIEMEINTTVTAFERGGPAALDRPRLINTASVRAAQVSGSPALLRQPIVVEAPRPRDRPGPPPVVERAMHKVFPRIFSSDVPSASQITLLEDMQRALGSPEGELGGDGPVTTAQIAIYSLTKGGSRTATSRLSRRDVDEMRLLRLPTAWGARNYFEWHELAVDDPLNKERRIDSLDQEKLATLLGRLQNVIGRPVADVINLNSPAFRNAIRDARARLPPLNETALRHLDEAGRRLFTGQLTPELGDRLPK